MLVQMKAVILAGGFGTRLSDASADRPKPLVEIGGKPILWHIMKIYSRYGINDFVICLGYKGYSIKEYFNNYFLHTSDVTFDLAQNAMHVHQSHVEPWRVTLIDTGLHTQTGGRLRRVREYLGDEDFCFTYGDAVTDLDIGALIRFHQSHRHMVTVTAVRPAGRFGNLSLCEETGAVVSFEEKPAGDGGWINGGFFVVSPSAIDYIDGDSTAWEHEPLQRLVRDDQFSAFRHVGFWQCMDTPRDKTLLEDLWTRKEAPWLA